MTGSKCRTIGGRDFGLFPVILYEFLRPLARRPLLFERCFPFVLAADFPRFVKMGEGQRTLPDGADDKTEDLRPGLWRANRPGVFPYLVCDGLRPNVHLGPLRTMITDTTDSVSKTVNRVLPISDDSTQLSNDRRTFG